MSTSSSFQMQFCPDFEPIRGHPLFVSLCTSVRMYTCFLFLFEVHDVLQMLCVLRIVCIYQGISFVMSQYVVVLIVVVIQHIGHWTRTAVRMLPPTSRWAQFVPRKRFLEDGRDLKAVKGEGLPEEVLLARRRWRSKQSLVTHRSRSELSLWCLYSHEIRVIKILEAARSAAARHKKKHVCHFFLMARNTVRT